MKKITQQLILLCSIAVLISCSKENICTFGSGNTTTKNVSVPEFSGIVLNGNDNVTISQGPQKVEVTGKSNIIDRLETYVSNGIWNIKLEEGCYKNADLSFAISVPNISDIKLIGSGNITVNDFIDQNDLYVDLIGSGKINMNENTGTENLKIYIEGSGKFNGFGNFANLNYADIEIFGSGEFNGFPIHANNTLVTLKGSGNCRTYSQEKLEVTIQGSGDLFYKGNPNITVNITGTGKVIDAN